jgi:16S rRNA (adenine1518-N6/adenine1519-N6)-dimethyltransferase
MGERARKRFGQNFLHDPAVIQRIVQAVEPSRRDHLVEIGPGRGAITGPLLTLAGRLDVVELDRDLIAPLETACAGIGELHIHRADALTFEFCQLAGGSPIRIVGNLPYNISTPILFHLLDAVHCIKDMHLMLQKEVVDRMAAEPGSRTYGRLSVMVQARCRVVPLFEIGPGAFRPAPKVVSAFVRLLPYRATPVPITDHRLFGEVVARAFAQRRKTLRNSLRGLVAEGTLDQLGIDPGQRAECLSLADFSRIANAVDKTSNN